LGRPQAARSVLQIALGAQPATDDAMAAQPFPLRRFLMQNP
jgi:hypothetical protein